MSQSTEGFSFKESVSISLDNADYYLQPFPAFEIAHSSSETKLAVVLDSSILASSGFPENLPEVIANLQSKDDVLTAAFADQATFFAGGLNEEGDSWATLNDSWKRHQSNRQLLSLGAASSLPKGPYFWRGSYLHQAWRLFPDYYSAFVTPVVPTQNKYRFEPLKATAQHGDSLAVAVPSRLYFESSVDKPLSGKRIGIKDNVHLEGIKTSNGNRAYTDCYGPQPETAALVKLLIDQGAVIIGKQKLNAFAGSEKPPDQCIDYFAPWNPRADGYQRPAGSTSGGGSSVAGYDWIDSALGTDTTGSLREPARACGLYGLKLSNKITSAEGLDPSSAEIDSYGYLTRSLTELQDLVKSSLGDKASNTTKLPKRLLYPTDWLPYQLKEQQELNEEFLKAIEQSLGIQRTEICIADEWKKTAPDSLRNIPIAEYLKNSGFWPLYYDNYHNNDQFRADYREKFGKEVYVSPSQGWKWELGSKVTPEERERGLSEIKVYKEWVAQHILTTDADGHTETIIFLPLGNAKPEYRDVQNKPPQVVASFEPKYFASVLGLPQIVVPIAQLPYESRVSGRTEYTPVIATFAGPQRSELTLIDVAEAALKSGAYPESVSTGRFMYPAADNVRHTSGVEGKL